MKREEEVVNQKEILNKKDVANQKEIGMFLKNLREENNLTQEQLATEIHYSRDVISQIERGLTMPSHEKVVAFAKLYGITVAEIYAAKKKESKKNQKVEAVLEDKTKKKTKKSQKEKNNNKPKKKHKIRYILLLIFIFLLLFVLLLFVYYFINSYNSIRLYKVYGESEKFETNNGILYLSKDKIYFSLHIFPKEEIEIEDISLRYINSSKEDQLVCSQSGSNLEISFIDYYGYDAYLKYEEMMREDGILYVEIKYNGVYDLLELNLEKLMSNDQLLFQKTIGESSGNETHRRTYLPTKIEQQFKKEDGEYTYETKIEDKDVRMVYFLEAGEFLADETTSQYEYHWIYHMEYKYLTYICEDIKTSEFIEKRKMQIDKVPDEDKEVYEYFKKNYLDVYIN